MHTVAIPGFSWCILLHYSFSHTVTCCIAVLTRSSHHLCSQRQWEPSGHATTHTSKPSTALNRCNYKCMYCQTLMCVPSHSMPWIPSFWLLQLKQLGHSVDKVEYIVMGGTFMALDEEYRDFFIRNLHDALSGHTSSSVDEAVRWVGEREETICRGHCKWGETARYCCCNS